jgi:hypothetical protein
MAQIRSTVPARWTVSIAGLLFFVRCRATQRRRVPDPVALAPQDDLLGAALTVARRA